MTGSADGTILLKALISGNPAYFAGPDSETYNFAGNKKITGFFFSIQESEVEFVDLCAGGTAISSKHTQPAWMDLQTKAETAELTGAKFRV